MIYVDPQSAIAYWRARRASRFMPRPEPLDLVRESAQRTERAGQIRDAAFAEAQDVTWDWPDPYGPDPVVFGAVPRFKNPFDD